MKDLIVNYENENGQMIKQEYDRIFDFTEEMESNKADIPMLDYGNVTATFFEKRTKNFDTIDDLYHHCVEIMKWLNIAVIREPSVEGFLFFIFYFKTHSIYRT